MSGWLERLGPNRNVRILQAAAGLRNVCQGIALVDMSLYLKGIGWSGAAIGAMYASAGIFRMAVLTFAGELNGRLGAKRYLIAVELLAAAAAIAVLLGRSGAWIVCAAAVSGFGAGHTGSGGLSGPVESGWLAASSRKGTRSAFGIHSAVGYAGLALGCLLGGVPSLRPGGFPEVTGCRLMFAAVAALSLVCAWMIGRMTGGERKSGQSGGSPRETEKTERTGFVGLLNALAVTLAGSMTAYWLTARFGASAAGVGWVLALTYAAAGAASIAGERAARRYGPVRPVVAMQIAGTAALAALPFARPFWAAALLSAAASSLHLGTRGNRNVVLMSGRTRIRRTWPTRLRSFLARAGMVLWPGAFGRLLDAGHWALPFLLAAAVQLGAALWYASAFRASPSAGNWSGFAELHDQR